MGKSGIITKKDTGKDNEAYHDIITLLKIYRSVNWRMQVKIGQVKRRFQAEYGSDVDEFLSMRPGITGWWQVSARNDATYCDGSRQELELYYVRNATLALDARVFLKTFAAIFEKTGK